MGVFGTKLVGDKKYILYIYLQGCIFKNSPNEPLYLFLFCANIHRCGIQRILASNLLKF